MLNTIKEKIIMLIYKGVIVSLVLGFLIQTVTAFPLYAFVVNEDEIERVSINTVNEVDEEDIKLLYEIEEYRSDFLKVFKRSDGKLEYAYYDEQANYFDGEKYVEVDAQFTENGSDLDSVVNKYSVKIPKKINENKKIKLLFDDASIELTYNGINKSTGVIVDNSNDDTKLSNLKKLKGEVLYSNIFDNVDLKLASTGSYFKENIILNKYIENFSFEYVLKLKKLTLVEEENTIKFINSNNELVYTIDPYFMIDESSKVSYKIDVKYELIKDGEYKFIVTPSDEYLKNANYPVVIDPVFTYESNSTTSSIIRTKTIWKNMDTVFDSSIQLTKFINVTDEYTEDLGYYALMEINFLAIPNFDNIHSATLTLRGNSPYYIDPVVVRRVNTSRNYSMLTLDNIDGLTEYVTYSETFDFENLGEYFYGINLTDFINENEFYEYNGVAIFELSPECFSGNEVSQYYNSHMSSSYKPYLSIIVLEDAGLSPYRTYEEISYGDSGNYYIDRLNGYGVFSLPVNNEFDLPFNYYYSSLEKDVNKGFGKGFNLSVCESVEKLTYNDLIYYCFTDGTGYKEYFYYDETKQKYCSEAGDNGYILVNNDIVYYYKDDIIKQFNSNGLLSCITYEYVNKYQKENKIIYLSYDSENYLSDISCGDYYISFSYEGISGYKVLTDALVCRIIYNSDSNINNDIPAYTIETFYSIKFEYDTYGNLIQLIKYKDNYNEITNEILSASSNSTEAEVDINNYKTSNQVKNCYFEYDENNYLITAFTSNSISTYSEDPESYEGIYVTYENNQITKYGIKVKTQTSLKELMNIYYYENNTEFVDYTGYKKTFSFDYFGHTISLFDSDGYAIYYEYENFAGELGKSNPDYLIKNQIKSVSDPLNVLNNPILNSSFEDYNGIDEIPYWTEGVEGQDTGRVVEGNDVPFGEKVLELSKSGSETIDYEVYQTVALAPGTYNLSAFVKVADNIFYDNVDYVGYIKVMSSSGELLHQNPYEFNNPEYKLASLSFYLSVSMEVKIICGIKSNSADYGLLGADRAYFDNIQITNNVINNLPNIIPNHSFESNSNWNKGLCGFYDRPNIYLESDITKLFGVYELNVPYFGTATQDFFYNTSSNEKFNLGGFARYVDGHGDLGLSVRFYNSTSGVTTDYYEVKFPSGSSGDVYVSSDLIIDDGKDISNTYNKIEIKIKNYGSSTCKIDNIHLMQIHNSKSYNYDENGFVSNVETEDETISYVYDEDGKIKTITTKYSIYEITETEDELGEIAEYTTLIEEKDLDGTVTSSFKESSLMFHVDSSYCTYPVYQTTDYIAQIKISSDKDGFATSTGSIYDIKRNLIVATYDEFYNKTKYEYDKYDRLIKVINTINEGDDEDEYDVYTEYVYNNDNSIYSTTSGISQDDGILKAKKITYEYDDSGNIIKITLNDNTDTSYTFEYDMFNYLTKVYHNETKLIEYVYQYDEYTGINTGLVQKEIKPNGEYTLYTYCDNFTIDSCSKGIINENGEIEEKLCYNILYDEYGKVGYYVDHFEKKSYYYNYDYNGNLIKINILHNKEDIQSDNHDYISFSYNENNDIVSTTYYFNGETLTDYFYYDSKNELDSIRINDFIYTNPKECIEGATKYVESSVSYVNGDQTTEIVKELAYYDNTSDVWTIYKQKEDPTGTHSDILGVDESLNKLSSRICKQEFLVGSNPNIDKYKYTYSYTYDEFGNINSITFDDPTGTSKDRTYMYGYELNELRYEMVICGIEVLLTTIYTYDSYGNVTKIERSYLKEEYSDLPATQEFSYNNLNQLVSYSVDGVTVASNIQYDENGNPLSLDDYSLTFVDGKLVKMVNSNNTITYEYNSLGVRTKKIVNGVIHEYVTYGDMILSEIITEEIDGVTVTDEIKYLYDANGTAIGFVYGTGNYYYIRNLTGEITHIVDENSMIFGEYRYDAFGNLINAENLTDIAQINSIRYKGYYYDVETNLALVSSRYYSPELGRFIQPADVSSLDPQSINGLNLYTYANNNPIGASYSNSDSTMSEFSVDNNLITFENSQTPINSSIFNQTIKGSFKSGLWSGNISLTGLYADWNARAQISLRKGTFKLGVAGKFSLVNNSGQIGFGTDDLNFSIKGVGDLGTISGMAGIFIDPRENYYIIGVEAEAAVLSGRIGGQLEIFGLQIEGGVSGKVLAIGGKFGIGYNDGELYYHSGFSVLFGWDIYIRIRFDKLFR